MLNVRRRRPVVHRPAAPSAAARRRILEIISAVVSLVLVGVGLAVTARPASAAYATTLTNFDSSGNQVTRYDTAGNAVDAHDGKIALFDGGYYLYGTSY